MLIYTSVYAAEPGFHTPTNQKRNLFKVQPPIIHGTSFTIGAAWSQQYFIWSFLSLNRTLYHYAIETPVSQQTNQ